MSDEKKAEERPDEDGEIDLEKLAADEREVPEAPDDPGLMPPALRISELERQVAGLEQQLSEMKDRALRALADAENVRKRADREKKELRDLGGLDLAREMLGVADNLRRTVEAVPVEELGSNAELASLVEGVELTERDLLKAFEKHGIEKLNPIGEKLDPNFHQAMVQLEDENHPAGTIVQVMQSGYVMKGRLLRAAMVAVSKGSAEAPSGGVDTTA